MTKAKINQYIESKKEKKKKKKEFSSFSSILLLTYRDINDIQNGADIKASATGLK